LIIVEVFADEAGYIKDDENKYITDNMGIFIKINQ